MTESPTAVTWPSLKPAPGAGKGGEVIGPWLPSVDVGGDDPVTAAVGLVTAVVFVEPVAVPGVVAPGAVVPGAVVEPVVGGPDDSGVLTVGITVSGARSLVPTLCGAPLRPTDPDATWLHPETTIATDTATKATKAERTLMLLPGQGNRTRV